MSTPEYPKGHDEDSHLKQYSGMTNPEYSSVNPQGSYHPQDIFTSSEKEVIQLLCQQFTTQEIADHLSLSVKEVENHKSILFEKAGVRNSLGLVMFAIKSQMVNPEEIVLLDRGGANPGDPE